MKREFPFPLPYGWFQVSYSDELAVGEVKPIHYFNRELVLFRTDDGAAHVWDAFCPHLGAHVGYGGKVAGNRIRCPFHAWEYRGSDGKCAVVPYAKRIPPAAAMTTYPVVEKNGMIMTWYHPNDAAPEWEIPDVPEYGDPNWTPYERREWIVRSRNMELAENTVDQAHFFYVHGTNTVASTEISTDGPNLHVVSKSRMGTSKGEADGEILIDTLGFGFGTTRFKGIVDLLVLTSGAPIDDERVHMRLSFSVRKLENSDATKGVGKAFIAEIERQFAQDIPIWEHKIHLERPTLCDGDGPIGTLRSWGRQFYVDTMPPSGEVG
jgi:3-ketosteroid 9alpha-monooxygenase subunit A